MKHIWWGLVIIACCYLIGCAASEEIIYQDDWPDYSEERRKNALIEECYKNHPEWCYCASDTI